MSADYIAYVFYGIEVKPVDGPPENEEDYYSKLLKPYGLKHERVGYTGDRDDLKRFAFIPSSCKSLYGYGDITFDPSKITSETTKNLQQFIKDHKDKVIKRKPKWVLGMILSY